MHARHHEARLAGDELRVALEEAAFGLVVGLLRELALGLGRHAGHVDAQRQQVEEAQQHGHVVHVARDRAGHAGVLDLEREDAPIRGRRAMHLPDRGGGHGLPLEVREALLPALAVLAAEHAADLLHGHGCGLRTQHGERLGELRRQDVIALQRHELPDLHGRAAQPPEPGREPRRVGRGKERLAEFGRLPAREAAEPLGGGTEGELPGRHADPGESFEAGLGDGRGGRLAGHYRRVAHRLSQDKVPSVVLRQDKS